MLVRFWGVRGSTPTPLAAADLRAEQRRLLLGAHGIDLADPSAVDRYLQAQPDPIGGHTACIEVRAGDQLFILDAGSGLRLLGQALLQESFGQGQGEAHILLSHGHWDHLQGFPFFTPAYIPGNQLHLYAVEADPRAYLDYQQTAPTYFPVDVAYLRADKHFHRLACGVPVQIGSATVNSLALYHPGVAYAYRIDAGGKSLVFASDGEYKSLAEADLQPFLTFFQGADLLVFDSQYALRDAFLSREDWGHSSVIIGVDLAERAGVKRLVTFHHDPNDSDAQIYAAAEAARTYARVNDIAHHTEVIAGREGLTVLL
jgi:phosphoribosyl 1,2-cyclic phosphodiesterase